MNSMKQDFGMAVCMAVLSASGAAFGVEATSEHRSAASIFARVESPLANRDQKAYCDAFYGTEDFRSYVARACVAGVKMGVRKPEQCTAEEVAAKAEEEHGKCLAMDGAAFDATIAKQSEGRAKFVKSMADLGIDGDKLIAEERAKIK